MTIYNCTSCSLYKPDYEKKIFVCPAFPDGIPEEVEYRQGNDWKQKPCNLELNQTKWQK